MTGTEIAKEMYRKAIEAGASNEQAARAVKATFVRLALMLPTTPAVLVDRAEAMHLGLV